MKKITFLLFTFLAFQWGNAQQTFSFEASEGFTLGNINGQNGWTSTGCGVGCFIENQVVSNTYSSTGTNALRITPESAYGTQTNPIIGGFYNFTAPIDYTTAVISYDLFVTETGESDFRFGVTGVDGMGAPFFTFIVDFNFQGNIRTTNTTGAFANIGTWTINTWYNIRAEVAGTAITYFINDVEVYQSTLLNNFNFTGLRLVHDNYGGDAYLDNLRINNEALSIDDQVLSSVSIYPNPSIDLVNIKLPHGLAIKNVQLFDMLGKSTGITIFNDKIDISSLSKGIYLLSIETENGSITKKIIKE